MPSIDVNASATFGQRLRELRTAAGLSQTDLAGDGVSASYVSLLESGKRSATTTTVDVLAKRLGCSPDYLLSGRDPEDVERLDLAVKYAEIALRNGEGEDALAHATAALEASSTAPPELVHRAMLLRAQALEATGRLDEAIRALEPLRKEAEDARRWQDSLRITVSLVRCYKELGDLRHALTLAEDGFARAAAYDLVGSDVHAELAAMVIGIHYLLGDLARAELLADEILSTIEGGGSRHARGSICWNASLTAEARGNVSKALVLAERALALYAEDDDERGIARLRNAYAWLLLRSMPPRPDEARRLLEQSHRTLSETGTVIDIAYCETQLGRSLLLLGEPKKALRQATSALQRLGDEPRHQTAHAMLVIARAKLLLDQEAEAIAGYREAAAMLTRLRVGRQAAEAWRELADAFTSLHKYKEAADAYQHALNEAGVPAPPDISAAVRPTRTARTVQTPATKQRVTSRSR